MFLVLELWFQQLDSYLTITWYYSSCLLRVETDADEGVEPETIKLCAVKTTSVSSCIIHNKL